MPQTKMTNILLGGILLILLVDLLMRIPTPKAVAETFELDRCITSSPNEQPTAYLHVVSH